MLSTKFVASIVTIVHQLLGDDDSPEEVLRAERLAVLKFIANKTSTAIKKIDLPFRTQVQANGSRFESRGAAGRELTIGRVKFRRFKDVVSTSLVADPVNVQALLKAKGLPASSCLDIATTVNFDKLQGLLATGAITEEDFESVTEQVTKTSTGKFTVTPLDELAELLQ